MKLIGITVPYPPTINDRSVSTFTVGVSRRTLGGVLDVHVRAIKKRWTITMLDQGFKAQLIPYLDGTPFEFEDLDGEEYVVALTSGIVESGPPDYPDITFTMEEV